MLAFNILLLSLYSLSFIFFEIYSVITILTSGWIGIKILDVFSDLSLGFACSVIPVKTTTNKYKTVNGLEIPGILFHLGEYSSELTTQLNNILSSVEAPDYNSITR